MNATSEGRYVWKLKKIKKNLEERHPLSTDLAFTLESSCHRLKDPRLCLRVAGKLGSAP
jgi:hypothetical protein